MPKIKGKTAEEIIQLKKDTTRVKWSMETSDGISFPFEGIPFICVGTANYQCHQGNDVDKDTKIKRQQERDEKEVVVNLICLEYNLVKLLSCLISCDMPPPLTFYCQ